MFVDLDLENLNSDQVALLLDISRRQVRNLVAAGMPSKGLGTKRRFVWEEIRPWFLRRKIVEGMSVDQSTKTAIIRLMEEPL